MCLCYVLYTVSFQHLGHTGVVNKLNLDETLLLLNFIVNGAKFRVVPDAVKKVCVATVTLIGELLVFQVEAPDLLPGDVVRVIDDMAEVHRLQKAGHGWDDDMALVSIIMYSTCSYIIVHKVLLGLSLTLGSSSFLGEKVSLCVYTICLLNTCLAVSTRQLIHA